MSETRREYRIRCDDWEATQVERSVVVKDRATGKVVKTIRIPRAWGDEWGWNFIDGGIAVEKQGIAAEVVSTEQAKQLLPVVRAAVAALHEVWAKCREVEQTLGHDLDCLEGIIQDMAAGVDNAESIDVDYVRDAINAQADELVAQAEACPKCGERRVDHLVWQKDSDEVRCTTCGKQYAPARRSGTSREGRPPAKA